MIRAVVVDDHPMFRKGLVALLRASDIDVVGEADSGLQALAVVGETQPDVVLMDVSMPDLDGIGATEQLVATWPGTRVVVITLFEDEATVRRALHAGASAYATKQATPEQILSAIDAAVTGAVWLGPGVPRPLAGAADDSRPALASLGLTEREAAVADLLGRGLPNPVIAQRLHLSVKTVANYVSIVVLKLGAADRAEAGRIVRTASGA